MKRNVDFKAVFKQFIFVEGSVKVAKEEERGRKRACRWKTKGIKLIETDRKVSRD